ncbi:MAG: SDR family NAD(P)-dependent oxidoreductase [Dehalococcoidia bacterium]
MDLELQGKVAIVTGGSKGIGKSIAQHLSEEGVKVVICARDENILESTVKEISDKTGGDVSAVRADMTSTPDVDRLIEETIKTYGRIDILVNNAAMVGGKVAPNILDATEKDLVEDIDTKIVGYFRTIKAVVPHMQNQKWGRIINIGGLSARQSSFFGLRNSAVVHMTKTLSDQLGPDGITLNVVHPGSTATDTVLTRQNNRAEQQNISVEKLQEINAERVAIRRIIQPEELAYIVCFLASPKAESITGESIAAGGGSLGAVFH